MVHESASNGAVSKHTVKDKQRSKLTLGLFLAIVLCGFGSIHRGFSLTEFNPVEDEIKGYLNNSFVHGEDQGDEESNEVATLWSMLVSIRYIGQVLACILVGPSADKLGRRSTLVLLGFGSSLLSLLQNVGVHTEIYALLLIGRIINGFGDGVIVMVVPLHLNEIAPTRIRGGITTVHNLLMSLGCWIPSILSFKFIFGTDAMWQWMIVVNTAIALPMLLLLAQPEGAKFQNQHRRSTSAIIGAVRYYEGEHVDAFKTVQLLGKQDTIRVNPLLSFFNLILNKNLRNNLFLTVALAILVCFSGIGAVTNYLTGLLELSGLTYQNAKWCFLGISIARTIAAVALVFAVDRIGRRKLIIGSACGICIVLTLICILQFLECRGSPRLSIIVAKVCMLAVWSVLVSFLTATVPMANFECYMQNNRASGAAAFFLISNAANYSMSSALPFITIAMGLYGVVAFLPLLVLSTAYIQWKLPETTNKEAAVIQNEISGRLVVYRF